MENKEQTVEPGHCYGNPNFKTEQLNLKIINEINNASIKMQFLKWLDKKR